MRFRGGLSLSTTLLTAKEEADLPFVLEELSTRFLRMYSDGRNRQGPKIRAGDLATMTALSPGPVDNKAWPLQ